MIKEQLEKEKKALKKVVSGYSTFTMLFWGILGFLLLFTPAFILGLIFLLGSGYFYFQKK